MNRFLAASLLLFCAHAVAQDLPAGLRGPAVSMAPPPVVSIQQGKAGTVPLSFRVIRGFHVNSNKPSSEFLIPTALKVDATTDIVIGRITYPVGKDMSFPFAPDEKLNVYSGDFQLGVIVRPLLTVQTGKYMIRGSLKYQACDNAACYPPKTLPVAFQVRISKAPPAAHKNPAQSPHAHK